MKMQRLRKGALFREPIRKRLRPIHAPSRGPEATHGPDTTALHLVENLFFTLFRDKTLEDGYDLVAARHDGVDFILGQIGLGLLR